MNSDGIVYKYNGVITIQAAGICNVNSAESSTMYVCESSTVLNFASYLNGDCSGNPTSSTPVTASFGFSNITDYTITCCSGNQCQYGTQTTYLTSTCSDDKSTASSTSETYTIGICGGSPSSLFKFPFCSNGKLRQLGYVDVDDCSGSPSTNTTISDGDCNSNTGNQIGISCNTAIDTCPGTSTTSTTLSPDSPQSSVSQFMVIFNMFAVMAIFVISL